MKQRRSLALLLAMSMCASAFAFTACGETAHEHTRSEWKSDNTNHWKVCTSCGAELDKAPHSFSDGVCSVCNAPDPNAEENPNNPDQPKPEDPVEEELPPLPYDPSTDKETPGLDYVEITDEDGAIKGYRVKPGATFDSTVEELFLPQRHNNMPVLCVGLDEASYREASESGMSEVELDNFYKANGFYKCSFIKTVHIGPETTTIGAASFAYCSNLTEIEFPERLRSIEPIAFGACYSLKDLTFPDGLKKIGFHAFEACQGLEKITLPAKLKTLDDGAFYNTVSVTEVNLNDSLESIGAYAFGSTTALKTITLNDSLDSIGDFAFAESGLTSIDFGNSVQTIGEMAFFSCGSLESVDIPDSVTTMGKSCFEQCITQVVKEDGTSEYTAGLKHVKIGSGLAEIPERAFGNNMLLETVELTGTQIIGEYAFFACQNLKNFNFGESLLKIEEAAFWSCTGFTELVFPDSLIEIGKGAFQMCRGLKKVTLGVNISTIGEVAFDYCYDIEEVIYRGSFEDWKFVNNNGKLKSPTQFLGGN